MRHSGGKAFQAEARSSKGSDCASIVTYAKDFDYSSEADENSRMLSEVPQSVTIHSSLTCYVIWFAQKIPIKLTAFAAL